ncbi:MAG TPA: hypothetical protein VH558_05325 [Pseudolabrys sp.]
MIRDFRSMLPSEAAIRYENDGTYRQTWRDQLVMVGAASLAMIIVASIAILMGMA